VPVLAHVIPLSGRPERVGGESRSHPVGGIYSGSPPTPADEPTRMNACNGAVFG